MSKWAEIQRTISEGHEKKASEEERLAAEQLLRAQGLKRELAHIDQKEIERAQRILEVVKATTLLEAIQEDIWQGEGKIETEHRGSAKHGLKDRDDWYTQYGSVLTSTIIPVVKISGNFDDRGFIYVDREYHQVGVSISPLPTHRKPYIVLRHPETQPHYKTTVPVEEDLQKAVHNRGLLETIDVYARRSAREKHTSVTIESDADDPRVLLYEHAQDYVVRATDGHTLPFEVRRRTDALLSILPPELANPNAKMSGRDLRIWEHERFGQKRSIFSIPNPLRR